MIIIALFHLFYKDFLIQLYGVEIIFALQIREQNICLLLIFYLYLSIFFLLLLKSALYIPLSYIRVYIHLKIQEYVEYKQSINKSYIHIQTQGKKKNLQITTKFLATYMKWRNFLNISLPILTQETEKAKQSYIY